MRQPLRARRALCLRLAEALANHFDLGRTHYDIDEAARLLEALLPTTYAEQEAEVLDFEETRPVTAPGPASGALTQLRTALGVGAEVGLVETIRAATERVQNPNRACREGE
jgi:hypothetical protein